MLFFGKPWTKTRPLITVSTFQNTLIIIWNSYIFLKCDPISHFIHYFIIFSQNLLNIGVPYTVFNPIICYWMQKPYKSSKTNILCTALRVQWARKINSIFRGIRILQKNPKKTYLFLSESKLQPTTILFTEIAHSNHYILHNSKEHRKPKTTYIAPAQYERCN